MQEYDQKFSHMYHPVKGAKETYNTLRYQYPVFWKTSFANKMGCLAQGVGTFTKSGNDNIFFIKRN